ncbi:MAG TPA: DUF1428 domain-containing protein [Pyrinomonadaceae bacterium]|nr:DUF1428 domain-containing protein [Pyrinomonadaceae bacterium]
MSRYIDGFVLPIPRARINDYQRVAEAAAEIWKEHGALEYWECTGDDLQSEGFRSFSDLISASPDETVVFAWVVFESREARDAANQKIMSDPRMATLVDPDNPIFDPARMAYGGFKSLVVRSQTQV